jgi:predicted dinucleotide-binding enzyme
MGYPIGILGSGSAARILGGGLLRLGHPVMLGSRDPDRLAEWRDEAGPGAHAGSLAATAAYGDLVVLSVLGRAAEDVVRLAGADNLWLGR